MVPQDSSWDVPQHPAGPRDAFCRAEFQMDPTGSPLVSSSQPSEEGPRFPFSLGNGRNKNSTAFSRPCFSGAGLGAPERAPGAQRLVARSTLCPPLPCQAVAFFSQKKLFFLQKRNKTKNLLK